MPNPLFDSSTLAIVAYAEVSGATGASTTCSDKMATTRLSQGTYQLLLATGLYQDNSRDLILVTPKVTTAIPATGMSRSASSFEVSAQEKQVIIHGNRLEDATTLLDSDFDVLVLRTTLP